MKKTNLNLDWKFQDLSRGDFFRKPEYSDVDLPNDYIYPIPRDPDAVGGSGNGYFSQGHGAYIKELTFGPECKDKRTILDLDGAYMNAEVYFDHDLIALHPYGYTPYLVDLTDHIRKRKHRLNITTHSPQPSSRWYSGGGLYRSVALWQGGQVCIEPWDAFVTTPVVGAELAVANANVKLHNYTDGDVYAKVCARVFDADGDEAAPPRASGSVTVRVPSGSAATGDISLPISTPMLWSPDSPALYTLKLQVYVQDALTDESEIAFGVRKFEVDAERGLRINGQPIKLKGGCIHHDNGFLGAAAYPRAEERKIEILKAAGYNAVRISHYPPSLAMLEACDRLGVILLDEAFDSWRQGKPHLDYHLYFEDWWERDISYMVLRDRNHPCVITYSIGNEIAERDGRSDGAAWAHRLADKIRSLDNTRFVTSAICGIFSFEEPLDGDDDKPADAPSANNFDVNKLDTLAQERDVWGEKTAPYAAALDIVGYNYLFNRYASDHIKFPGRVICGTETMAHNTFDYWQAVLDNPHVIGDFIWTAFDNLGEAGVGRVCWPEDTDHGFMGPYPWKTSFQSDHDLCGYRKPQSYYRELMWEHTDRPSLFTTHPRHFGQEPWATGWEWHDVEPTWTFGDEWIGKPVKAEVYARGDEAEFIVNGRSLGRSKIEKLIAYMDVPYEPGTLEAVIYKDGAECGRAALHTTGAPCRVVLTPDRAVVRADRQDLCYIAVTVVDKKGERVVAADNMLTCVVDAPGILAGIGNGDPKGEDVLAVPYCHAFEGRAMIAVRASQAGDIVIRLSADGIGEESCSISTE